MESDLELRSYGLLDSPKWTIQFMIRYVWKVQSIDWLQSSVRNWCLDLGSIAAQSWKGYYIYFYVGFLLWTHFSWLTLIKTSEISKLPLVKFEKLHYVEWLSIIDNLHPSHLLLYVRNAIISQSSRLDYLNYFIKYEKF